MSVHSTSKPYVCLTCGQSFTLNARLKKHERTHARVKCSQCRRLFDTPALLEQHRAAQHPTICACPVCSKRFKTKKILNQHMKKHESKQFACDECDRRFYYASKLLSHKKVMHSGEKSFLCDTCGKGFNFKYNLEIHRESHNTKCEFACEECGKELKGRRSLLQHRLRHKKEAESDKSKAKVTCEVCHKQLNPRYLRAHMHMHDDPKYKCDICGEVFKLQNTLYEHKRRVHMGIKKQRCVCDVCGLLCATKTTCLAHKMNVHMRIYIKHKCMICQVVYGERYKAFRHVRKMHPDEIPNKVVMAVKVQRVTEKQVEENDKTEN